MTPTPLKPAAADIDATQFLAEDQRGNALPDGLKDFPRTGRLTGAERFDILDAWDSVLKDVYAHLPLKRAM